MPRHVVREKEWEEENIPKLLETMKTYEDAAAGKNFEKGFSWKKHWWRLLLKPNPAKIYEISFMDADEMTPKKSIFFDQNRKEKDDDDDEENCPNKSWEEQEQEDRLNFWYCVKFIHKAMFWSRIYIFILQMISSNIFGEMFRTDAFNMANAMIVRGYSPVGEMLVDHIVGGLRRWDAQYFLFIIDGEYVYETTLMFFPGFVRFMRFVKHVVSSGILIVFGTEIYNWVLTTIMAVLVNWLFFHLTGMMLFCIAYQITRDVKVSLLSVAIYAYNPASIFFSAAYSEAGYAFLTFCGLSLAMLASRVDLSLIKASTTFVATLFFSSSVFFRSNGLLNTGFAMWYMIGAMVWAPETPYTGVKSLQERLSKVRNKKVIEVITNEMRNFKERESIARKEFRFGNKNRYALAGFTLVASFTVMIVALIIPSYIFNGVTITREFCNPHGKLAMMAQNWNKIMPYDGVLAGQIQRAGWCRKPLVFWIWPTYYSYIQKKYWDVEFLGYWQVRKIPCFLMAAPALILTAMAIRHTYREVFLRRKWYNIWVLFARTDHMVPYAIHASFLLFLGIFVMNVDAYTRLIFSSTPLLYVYLALQMDQLTQGNAYGNKMSDFIEANAMYPFFINRRVWDSGWKGKLFYIYFMGYFVFGTMAHAAWLPFT